jgi:hypothetical protein
MYVAGEYIGDAGTGFVQRSDDGGETWYASAPVPVPGPPDGWTARLHGVHPTDPDRIFFWVDHIEGSGTAEPDALWASSDGGGSWTQVHVAAGDLPGFALSPDARTLAISGPSDGLLIADLDELAASGAAGLSQVFDGRVYGLSWTDEGLYAGHDDFAATEPRFMVGVSRDGGHTFEPFMSICDAPPIACPPESSTATACAPLVEPTAVNPSGRYVSDFLEGPRCTESTGTVVDADAGGAVASSPAADAAAPQAPVATHGVEPGEQGGCGCSVPGRAAGRGSFGVWLMALAVAWRRSRSRR